MDIINELTKINLADIYGEPMAIRLSDAAKYEELKEYLISDGVIVLSKASNYLMEKMTSPCIVIVPTEPIWFNDDNVQYILKYSEEETFKDEEINFKIIDINRILIPRKEKKI